MLYALCSMICVNTLNKYQVPLPIFCSDTSLAAAYKHLIYLSFSIVLSRDGRFEPYLEYLHSISARFKEIFSRIIADGVRISFRKAGDISLTPVVLSALIRDRAAPAGPLSNPLADR